MPELALNIPTHVSIALLATASFLTLALVILLTIWLVMLSRKLSLLSVTCYLTGQNLRHDIYDGDGEVTTMLQDHIEEGHK